MTRSWLGLALVGVLGGCRATVQIPFSGAVSLQGVFPTDSRSTEPRGVWLRSAEDLRSAGLPMMAPDWSKVDVVAVSVGQQGTTGHRVTMERITLIDDAIVFDLLHEEPTGAVGEALTFPGVVVQLEKHLEHRRRVVRVGGVVIPCVWRTP